MGEKRERDVLLDGLQAICRFLHTDIFHMTSTRMSMFNSLMNRIQRFLALNLTVLGQTFNQIIFFVVLIFLLVFRTGWKQNSLYSTPLPVIQQPHSLVCTVY